MSAPGSPPAAGRTHFLDRLKVVLTVWVILHHTAITYGGNGGWFYRELPTSGSASSLVLTLFCAVNQAFFMGAFFLLAGYFTPPALAHKGAWHFVQDRLRRLGLPVLVFGLLLGPLTVALAGWRTGRPPSLGQFVLGPLWFAWALVCFSLAYVAWRRLRPAPPDIPDRPLPGSAAWAVAAIGVGASALALRQVVPVGDSVWGLQLGYFASYIFLFALGCVAQRHRWLERVDRQQALRWRRISLLAIPVLPLVAALYGGLQGRAVNFNGGMGWPAVVYALWEPWVAWGLIAWLLVLFRERFNTASARWQRLAAQAYAAFILHSPVLVAVSVALSALALPALLKFVLVGACASVLSFAIAGGLLRVPGVRRLLGA